MGFSRRRGLVCGWDNHINIRERTDGSTTFINTSILDRSVSRRWEIRLCLTGLVWSLTSVVVGCTEDLEGSRVTTVGDIYGVLSLRKNGTFVENMLGQRGSRDWTP